MPKKVSYGLTPEHALLPFDWPGPHKASEYPTLLRASFFHLARKQSAPVVKLESNRPLDLLHRRLDDCA